MEELRLINKQKNNELRKQQEEEMKQKKEEDEATRQREEEATAKEQATAMVQYDPNANPNNGNPSKNLNQNIHAIMNGEDGEETKAPGTNKDDKDKQSPTKKRGGSSKTSTKKKGGLRQVSPQEQGTTASKEKTTTFADEFVYPYS
jgi:hypothetical protein